MAIIENCQYTIKRHFVWGYSFSPHPHHPHQGHILGHCTVKTELQKQTLYLQPHPIYVCLVCIAFTSVDQTKINTSNGERVSVKRSSLPDRMKPYCINRLITNEYSDIDLSGIRELFRKYRQLQLVSLGQDMSRQSGIDSIKSDNL